MLRVFFMEQNLTDINIYYLILNGMLSHDVIFFFFFSFFSQIYTKNFLDNHTLLIWMKNKISQRW